jgi:hypothetical protein
MFISNPNLIRADPKQHADVTADTCIARQSTSDAGGSTGLSTSTAAWLYSTNPNQHAVTAASIRHLNPRQAKPSERGDERKLVPSKRESQEGGIFLDLDATEF